MTKIWVVQRIEYDPESAFQENDLLAAFVDREKGVNFLEAIRQSMLEADKTAPSYTPGELEDFGTSIQLAAGDDKLMHYLYPVDLVS